MEFTKSSQSLKTAYFIGITAIVVAGIGTLVAVIVPEPPLLIGVVFVLGFILILLYRPTISLYIFLLFWPIYPSVNRLLLHGSDNSILRLWQEAVLLLGILGIVLRIVLAKSCKLRVKSLDWVVLSLLAMSVYGSLLAFDPSLIIYGFHLTYTPVLMYFLVRLLPLRASQIRHWVESFLMVNLAIALIGIYIHFTDPVSYYLQMVPMESIGTLARMGRWRMASILANPLYFGILMALGATLSLALAFQEKKSFKRWYRLAAFAIFTVCTWLSITRGAWFMLAAGTVIVLWGYFRQKRSRMIWALFGISAAIFVGLVVLVTFRTGLEIYLSDSSGFLLEGRFDQWRSTWEAISKAPWGYGLGVGQAALRAGNTEIVTIYDGWYLKVLAEGGVLGIVVFAVFMIITVRFLVSRIAKARDKSLYYLYLGVLAVFVGLSLAAIGSNVWDYYIVPSVMWVLIGFMVTLVDSSTVDSICMWGKTAVRKTQA